MIDRSLNYGRHHVRRFLEEAAPYDRIVDLGAGTGADLEAALEVCPGAEAVAVEVHPPYAGPLEARGWKVLRLDIERDALPLPDASVDVVVANQILEHVKEIFWIFHQVSRVLSEGGHFIVGVPNLASLHNRLLLLLGRQPTALHLHSAHVRGFTRAGLLRFLDEVAPGLYQLMDRGGSNFYPFPPVVARPLARLFPSLAWGSFFLLRKRRPYEDDFLRYLAGAELETNYRGATGPGAPTDGSPEEGAAGGTAEGRGASRGPGGPP